MGGSNGRLEESLLLFAEKELSKGLAKQLVLEDVQRKIFASINKDEIKTPSSGDLVEGASKARWQDSCQPAAWLASMLVFTKTASPESSRRQHHPNHEAWSLLHEMGPCLVVLEVHATKFATLYRQTWLFSLCGCPHLSTVNLGLERDCHCSGFLGYCSFLLGFLMSKLRLLSEQQI